MSIRLHVVICPLLQLTLLHENLRLVHYFHVQTVILVQRVDLAALGVLDQFENIVAVDNDSLLLLPRHVVAQDLGDDLRV